MERIECDDGSFLVGALCVCRSKFLCQVPAPARPLRECFPNYSRKQKSKWWDCNQDPRALGKKPNGLRPQNPRRNCYCLPEWMQKHLKNNGSPIVPQSMQVAVSAGHLVLRQILSMREPYSRNPGQREKVDHREGRLLGLGQALCTGRPLVGGRRLGTVHESIVTWAAQRNFQAPGHENAADAGLGLLLWVSENCL